jgi:hypothetical protein
MQQLCKLFSKRRIIAFRKYKKSIYTSYVYQIEEIKNGLGQNFDPCYPNNWTSANINWISNLYSNFGSIIASTTCDSIRSICDID